MELEKQIENVKLEVNKRIGKRELLLSQIEHIEQSITEASDSLDLVTDAHKLLELFVKSTEGVTASYIEPLITEALDFVFAQYLKFHLMFMSRRNQVEVDFLVIRDKEVEELYQTLSKDPVKNSVKLEEISKECRQINYLYGGAINQVISMVLRLVLKQLLRLPGPVIFDEPTSAVGEEYSARVGQLLSSLSKKFGLQVILVTHSDTLASFADRSYRVNKIDDISSVKEVVG